MVSAECKAIMGFWRQGRQWGPGQRLRGSGGVAPEAESFFAFAQPGEVGNLSWNLVFLQNKKFCRTLLFWLWAQKVKDQGHDPTKYSPKREMYAVMAPRVVLTSCIFSGIMVLKKSHFFWLSASCTYIYLNWLVFSSAGWVFHVSFSKCCLCLSGC